MGVTNSCFFITTHSHRKMKTGAQLISMIHLVYRSTLMQTFHHLQPSVEELHGIFLQIFHLVQEVDHGVVGVEGAVVVEGVESKADKVSSMEINRHFIFTCN